MIAHQNPADLLICQMEQIQLSHSFTLVDPLTEYTLSEEMLSALHHIREMLEIDPSVTDLQVLEYAISYIQRLTAVLNEESHT